MSNLLTYEQVLERLDSADLSHHQKLALAKLYSKQQKAANSNHDRSLWDKVSSIIENGMSLLRFKTA